MLTWNVVLRWFAGVGVAISMKISSSIDDVVWLAPFLTSHANMLVVLKNATVYIAVCLVQTCVAMGIAYSGNAAVDMLTRGATDIWSTNKILTVSAAAMLAIYAVKLTYEYIGELRSETTYSEVPTYPEDEGSTKRETRKSIINSEKLVLTEPDPPPPGCCGGGATTWKKLSDQALICGQEGPVDSQQIVIVQDLERPAELDGPPENEVEREGQTRTLFVISFVGSVDDLTLFVPMLASKDFDLVQLVLGGFIAAAIIVLLCVFLGLCKPIANCLSKIPLALIVSIFAIVLIAKACFME